MASYEPYLNALVVGFLSSLLTGFFLGGKRASKLPGGAIGAAFGIAAVSSASIILCVFFGLLGWLVYALLYTYLNRVYGQVPAVEAPPTKYLFAHAKVMDTWGKTLMDKGDLAKVLRETPSFYFISLDPYVRIPKSEPNVEVKYH